MQRKQDMASDYRGDTEKVPKMAALELADDYRVTCSRDALHTYCSITMDPSSRTITISMSPMTNTSTVTDW
jgi:hypothetical protein